MRVATFSTVIIFMFLFLFLFVNLAHADFRNALDAYSSRNGQAMLKGVNDAVNRKNDDGLKLFLMAIRTDTFQSSRKYFYYNDDNRKPSTLRTILTKPQVQELYDLLVISSNYSNAESRELLSSIYFFDEKDKRDELFRVELQNKQEKDNKNSISNIIQYPLIDSYFTGDRAKLSYDDMNSPFYPESEIDWKGYERDLIRSAEVGNPSSQLALATIYAGVTYWGGGSFCRKHFEESICDTRDKDKSDYWLKKSVKTYEKLGKTGFHYKHKTSFCEFYSGLPYKVKEENLRERYLWCLYERSFPKKLATSAGDLDLERKIYAYVPELNDVARDIGKIEEKIRAGDLLPEMMKTARTELLKEQIPVFSYYVKDNLRYEIDVYKDGRVMIGLDDWPIPLWVGTDKDLLIKVSPTKVSSFLSELKKLGFETMPIYGKAFDDCQPMGCDVREFEFILASDVVFRRVYRSDRDQNLDFLNEKSEINMEIAPVITLVEKYFPTKQLRCQMGTSEAYTKACLEREKVWSNLAKSKRNKSWFSFNFN
jgi:hypothetical protein